MRIFRDLDLVEQLGSGVPRILKAYGKQAFQISENFIRVILPFSHGFDEDINPKIPHVTMALTETEEKALELIGQNPKITALEISETIDVSLRHAKRTLANLKDKGLISRDGSNKEGIWRVIIK